MTNYGIAVHGGAGTVSRDSMTKWKAEAYREALKRAYTVGFMVLRKGGTAIDAVLESITVLEDSPLFNAGKGSVFTHDGKQEMDAAIMDGKRLKAGGVAAVRNVKNPIILAHIVMKKSRHVLLSGRQALEFARRHGIQLESDEYFFTDFRYKQWKKALAGSKVALDHDTMDDKKYGTVGAVALDRKGNLAAGTSTGGMVNKKFGRIGDSPLIGMGTYANNHSCAISCTGHGEYFMRTVLSYDVSARMLYKGQSLKEACETNIHTVLPELGGRGGLIGIDQYGNIVMPFNTKGMYRGFRSTQYGEFVGIFKNSR